MPKHLKTSPKSALNKKRLSIAGSGLATLIALTLTPVAAQASTVNPATAQTNIAAAAGSIAKAGGGCSKSFTDVKPSGTFYSSITWMACEGLTNGYADGSFGVNQDITRGEVASFLYRISGDKVTPNGKLFNDVKTNSSHAAAITWMKAEGITHGYANGSFGVNSPITRGEITAFISRYADDSGYKAPSSSKFKDMNPRSSFYREISWITSKGMINGYTDGTFKPTRDVTRGETSKFLYALNQFENSPSNGSGSSNVNVSTQAKKAVDLAIQMSWADRNKSYVTASDRNGRSVSTAAYIANKEKAMRLHGADPLKNLYASCDRFVATTVKLNMDPSFPWGSTATQYNYMKKSPKWQQYSSYSKSHAKPGDVWITPKTGSQAGHAIFYIGQHGGRDTIAHASYHHRSAALDWASYVGNNMKDPSNRLYTGFRYVG